MKNNKDARTGIPVISLYGTNKKPSREQLKNVDVVIYMSEGKVVARGSFNEVRDAVPDFDRQAKLMGL